MLFSTWIYRECDNKSKSDYYLGICSFNYYQQIRFRCSRNLYLSFCTWGLIWDLPITGRLLLLCRPIHHSYVDSEYRFAWPAVTLRPPQQLYNSLRHGQRRHSYPTGSAGTRAKKTKKIEIETHSVNLKLRTISLVSSHIYRMGQKVTSFWYLSFLCC